MKKFCGVLFLTVALLLVGSYDNRAEAQDVYMGTWRSGYDAYLMTETINAYDRGFKCTVKAVRGSSVMYIDYHFYTSNTGWHFSNSDGVGNYVRRATSIEKNIVDFVSRNYRFDISFR